jgi:hypothetical protein
VAPIRQTIAASRSTRGSSTIRRSVDSGNRAPRLVRPAASVTSEQVTEVVSVLPDGAW